MGKYAGEPTSNFYRVSHIITESDDFKKLKPGEKILYWTLCRLRNRLDWKKQGKFIQSDSVLAEASGLSERTICSSRWGLKEKGFIDFVSKHGRRCKYHLWEPEDKEVIHAEGNGEETEAGSEGKGDGEGEEQGLCIRDDAEGGVEA